ncbi:MAG: hypothetical protein Q8Q32_02120 [bacterium]|nr:hypothetical protein [bacterium]
MKKLTTAALLAFSMLIMPLASFAQYLDLDASVDSNTEAEAGDDAVQGSSNSSVRAGVNVRGDDSNDEDDGIADDSDNDSDADDSDSDNDDSDNSRPVRGSVELGISADLRARIQAFQDAHTRFRAELAENREGAEERFAEYRARLRARLAQFQNENRAEVTARIATNFNEINGRVTAKWADILENLRDILLRVEAKANDLGEDISAELDAAAEAIADAEAAVEAQAELSYELEIESEETVGENVAELRAKMIADLQATKAEVMEARAAVGGTFTLIK